MNKFYKEICKYYEDIFPKNESQLNFLNNISDGKDYLDIGCATGLVAKKLRKLRKKCNLHRLRRKHGRRSKKKRTQSI